MNKIFINVFQLGLLKTEDGWMALPMLPTHISKMSYRVDPVGTMETVNGNIVYRTDFEHTILKYHLVMMERMNFPYIWGIHSPQITYYARSIHSKLNKKYYSMHKCMSLKKRK